MPLQTKGPTGCKQCRRAKKKCTMEQPSCARCLRQDKQCSGYQNAGELRFRDQTLAVTRKFGEKTAQLPLTTMSCWIPPEAPAQSSSMPGPFPILKTGGTGHAFQQSLDSFEKDLPVSVGGSSSKSLSSWIPEHAFTPDSRETDVLDGCSIIGDRRYYMDDAEAGSELFATSRRQSRNVLFNFACLFSIPDTIMPQPEDLAINYFLHHFAFQNGHWDYVIGYAAQPEINPSLTLAIKACGMAALNNVHSTPRAGAWSRHMYGKALSRLNSSLCDPRRSTTDESLIAVNLLSFYEVSWALNHNANKD